MFDIGFWEILIITLVALLVVGPERLPGLAREIGRFVGKTRRFVNSVRSDIEQELQTDELRKMLKGQEKEIQELKSMMQETEDTLRDDLRTTEDSLRAGFDDMADEKKTLEPTGKPGAREASASAADGGKDEPQADPPPQMRRVPVKGQLNADLLTDTPEPVPTEPAKTTASADTGARSEPEHPANKA